MNKVAIFLILLKYIILIKRAQRKSMDGVRGRGTLTIFDCWIIIAYFAAYLGSHKKLLSWRCLIGFLPAFWLKDLLDELAL